MSKKISVAGLFTAFAVVLSYVETFIPSIGIPGVKLGLANFAILIALYYLGYRFAITINIVRIIIIGFFFGNLFSICFSIAGAVISFIAMSIAKASGKLSMITVAVIGGVFHNLGQVIIAMPVIGAYEVIYYLPVLIVSGFITGAIIGILSRIIYNRTENILKNMEKIK